MAGRLSSLEVHSPLQGVVVAVPRTPGDAVRAGATVVVVESMKMEHAVPAPQDGVLLSLAVAVGDEVHRDDLLATLGPGAPAPEDAPEQPADEGSGGLSELRRRRALLRDEERPKATALRHAAGRRTVREDLADLLDPGSWVEWGALAVAAQRARRSAAELEQRTQADGLVAGLGSVNADLVGPERAHCAVLAYDYAVLAGTQGTVGHLKTDRFLEVVERLRVPVVLFAEGGGGRPGDTDHPVVTGLHTTSFALWAGLSGLVPRIGIVSGNCFAGNAALLGCADVVIATEGSSIGMGGPAMIEGGGLGRYTAAEVGPVDVQAAGGVVDVVVEDDAAAVATARRALAYFQGRTAGGAVADQERLRSVLPAGNRAYDVRAVVELLADQGSVLELRGAFGREVVTALVRLDGRPVGVLASQPSQGGGAVTSDAADKAARFLQLCDAFDLPVLSLVDTPGIMVGPAAEATGLVRHSARLFTVAASLTVPVVAVVLRRAYGLGAQAMMLGSTRAPLLTVAWPDAELGAMGIEGAVRLSRRAELAELPDDASREARVAELVAQERERGRAVPVATAFEIDDVIDPADTRATVLAVLAAAGDPAPRSGRKRVVDTW